MRWRFVWHGLERKTDCPRRRRDETISSTTKERRSIPFSSLFGFQVERGEKNAHSLVRSNATRRRRLGSAVPPLESPLILILALVARPTSTNASRPSFVMHASRDTPLLSQNLELLVARVQPLGSSSSALCSSGSRVDCKRDLRLGFALGKQAGERVRERRRSIPSAARKSSVCTAVSKHVVSTDGNSSPVDLWVAEERLDTRESEEREQLGCQGRDCLRVGDAGKMEQNKRSEERCGTKHEER
ncbi:hypothetical protein BJY59DRAFT_401156 [Rhodotorula toruloides]